MIKLLAMLTLIFYVQISGLAKGEKRLQRLYEKGAYEACYKKAKKLKIKNPKNGTTRLFLSKLELIKPITLDKNPSVIELKRSIIEYIYAEKYGVRDRDFYYDVLRPKIKRSCGLYLKNRDTSKALILAKPLAKYMKDTLGFYSEYIIRSQINYQTERPSFKDKGLDEKEDSLRKELLKAAEKLTGVPYIYGGESELGFDCSGFTKYVFAKIGIDLPHNAQMQSKLGTKKALTEAKEGDLVFFGYKQGKQYKAIHAGIIYSHPNTPDSSVVHCVSKGVAIEGKGSSWDRYWMNKGFVCSRRNSKIKDRYFLH